MSEKDKTTEEKILEAARRIFVEKGMAGARMQQIADEAGINKSLLHYYYRSKDKLFLAVFRMAIRDFIPSIKDIIFSDVSVYEKLDLFINEYMDVLLSKPFVPMFILQEIQRDPERLFNVFLEAGIRPDYIMKEFKRSIETGTIREINPTHLIINVLSLCIFPIAARPMMQRMFYDNDP
ncbi:MAG TPA: TetR/AcrR family transcriptional regulator, partial [Bacteroidales bacterium]|nr:TetR/AcrR family transcriptional regulator [Bacteroidales bacterium]